MSQEELSHEHSHGKQIFFPVSLAVICSTEQSL